MSFKSICGDILVPNAVISRGGALGRWWDPKDSNFISWIHNLMVLLGGEENSGGGDVTLGTVSCPSVCLLWFLLIFTMSQNNPLSCFSLVFCLSDRNSLKTHFFTVITVAPSVCAQHQEHFCLCTGWALCLEDSMVTPWAVLSHVPAFNHRALGLPDHLCKMKSLPGYLNCFYTAVPKYCVFCSDTCFLAPSVWMDPLWTQEWSSVLFFHFTFSVLKRVPGT